MASEAAPCTNKEHDSLSFVSSGDKMKTLYSHHTHSVGDNFWHIQWCPKYRYRMFRKFKYKNLAAACIRKTAKEHGMNVHALEVMEDHIHIVVSIPHTMSVSKATQLLKGRSSYLFFRSHAKARLRYPQGHLWSRGTFRTSVGYSDLPTTLNYVNEQQKHHAPPLGNLSL